jgi:hypothetical protein
LLLFGLAIFFSRAQGSIAPESTVLYFINSGAWRCTGTSYEVLRSLLGKSGKLLLFLEIVTLLLYFLKPSVVPWEFETLYMFQRRYCSAAVVSYGIPHKALEWSCDAKGNIGKYCNAVPDEAMWCSYCPTGNIKFLCCCSQEEFPHADLKVSCIRIHPQVGGTLPYVRLYLVKSRRLSWICPSCTILFILYFSLLSLFVFSYTVLCCPYPVLCSLFSPVL